MRFHDCNSRKEFETLERAIPSTSAMSSAASGCFDAYNSAWIWLTERLTPQRSPRFPHSRTNCRTANGMLSFVSIISVITEITDYIVRFVKTIVALDTCVRGAV